MKYSIRSKRISVKFQKLRNDNHKKIFILHFLRYAQISLVLTTIIFKRIPYNSSTNVNQLNLTNYKSYNKSPYFENSSYSNSKDSNISVLALYNYLDNYSDYSNNNKESYTLDEKYLQPSKPMVKSNSV